MAFGPAFDSMSDPSREGTVLTFVLPANRCNLRCSSCVIRQRKEAESIELEVEDYIEFIESALKKFHVSHIAVQGYEPLLDESWPFTSSIVNYANQAGIEVSLVTNGICLGKYINQFGSLAIKKFSISLDAPSPRWHDLQRGVAGAFSTTTTNIIAASNKSNLAGSLWVTSVLYPGHAHELYGMPKFLKEININKWSVSPLFKIGYDDKEGWVEFSYDELKEAILALYKHACDAGIEFRVDDEFSMFRNEMSMLPFSAYRTISRLDNFIRLSPSGFCSIGRDILKRVASQTPRWRPGMERADVFFDKLHFAS
jgi:MoaA/NifB/PqqE/SkfB family radical SAM enzyme